jgi:hypothetical protein
VLFCRYLWRLSDDSENNSFVVIPVKGFGIVRDKDELDISLFASVMDGIEPWLELTGGKEILRFVNQNG